MSDSQRDEGPPKATLLIAIPSTVKSPHILELSGIGNSATLEAAKIPVQVDLPAVGENLQDHLIFCGNMWRTPSSLLLLGFVELSPLQR